MTPLPVNPTAKVFEQGLVDTNVLILHAWVNPADLPLRIAMSAVSLAELSAGVLHVRGNDAAAGDERARRAGVLQWVESEFSPIPFDAAAARVFGRISSAVLDAGRQPRRRMADLMIAATAAANELPLFTSNPDDFAGLEGIVEVVPVARPDLS